MSKDEARRRLASLLPPEIPSLDNLDRAVLPPVLHTTRAAVVPVVFDAPVEATGTGKLTHLVHKSLDTLEECLDCRDTDPDTVRLMSMRKETALGVLNTQAKVDDTALRHKQTDMLPKLLEIIAREEKRLPAVVIDHVLGG